jgi:hypothetical protein
MLRNLTERIGKLCNSRTSVTNMFRRNPYSEKTSGVTDVRRILLDVPNLPALVCSIITIDLRH